MNAVVRRRLEMGLRALNFSRAHPAENAGCTAAIARLEQDLARAEVLAMQQRSGILAERTASVRKQELRDQVQHLLLAHVAHVAHTARFDAPDLAKRFRLPPENQSYQSFRLAARVIAKEAQEQKDLLIRHGLAEPMLTGLAEALDQFDAAMEQGAVGRRDHAGARAELDAVLEDVVAVVAVIGDFNRFRFRDDSDTLNAWKSTSAVQAAPEPADAPAEEEGKEGTPSSPDALKPAA